MIKTTISSIIITIVIWSIIVGIGYYAYKNLNTPVFTNEDYRKIDTIMMKITDTIVVTKEKIKLLESNIKTKEEIQNDAKYNIQVDTNIDNNSIREQYEYLFSDSTNN